MSRRSFRHHRLSLRGKTVHCPPLPGHGTDSWLNNANFPKGVYYEVITTDNIKINQGVYSENAAGLTKNHADVEHLRQRLKDEADAILEKQLAEFPEDEMRREVERRSVLRGVDVKWMEHIDDMEQLRQGIGLQSMGGKDPIVEYKLAAYDMFNDMLDSIKETTTQLVFHTRYVPNKEVEREEVAKATGTNKDDTAKKKAFK